MSDWIEAKVTFKCTDLQVAADLIADAFYESGSKEVVIDDPDLSPDEGWGSDAIGPPVRHGVTGYFPHTQQASKQCWLLEKRITDLSQSLGIEYDIEFNRIDEEKWAESWKAFFRPEKITDTIVVKPTWREYDAGPGEIVLEIDPGMAFGTGTHPTTAMCLDQIEKYLEHDASFLDVGTGSGILMIAAAGLGAKKLLGIDKDEIAVRIAEANMMQNRIDPGLYRFKMGNLAESVDERFDLIAANILFGVILELLDTIHNNLGEKGVLVCSGILSRDEKAVTDKMVAMGYHIQEVMTREEWVCITGRHHPSG